MECERCRVARSRCKRRLVGAVGIETLDRGLWLGLDPEIARGADADEQGSGLRINCEMTILVALDDGEDALLGDHLPVVRAGRRLALVGRHLIDALLLITSRSQRPENIWHAPDAVLIRHKNMIALPDEPVGLVEVRDMAVNPAGAPVAVVTQQCEIAGALFGHQDVAVGQYELGASD